LTAKERQEIARLATDVPALWCAPTTTAADRQAIARLMLERVVVTVDGNSEKVTVNCHWAGGMRTSHALQRSAFTSTHEPTAPVSRSRIPTSRTTL
jgi:hypothetical protein